MDSLCPVGLRNPARDPPGYGVKRRCRRPRSHSSCLQLLMQEGEDLMFRSRRVALTLARMGADYADRRTAVIQFGFSFAECALCHALNLSCLIVGVNYCQACTCNYYRAVAP